MSYRNDKGGKAIDDLAAGFGLVILIVVAVLWLSSTVH